jgi:UDP-glucose 4-epimerase
MPDSSTSPRFLVTGAKGFIGSWIVKALLDRGHRSFIFDVDAGCQRLQMLLREEEIHALPFILGDVTRTADVERAVAENGITHILHLAGIQVPGCAADPVRGALVNVIGTLNMFEAARRHKTQVKRLVYASSAAVFGPEEFYGGQRVPEGAQLLPGSHYGVFKQCNEGNARVYFQTEGIPSVGIRPWTVYGVGRDLGMTSGPTKAIKAAVVGRPYTIRFIGPTDMQYVRDTAEIFIACALRDIPGARTYTPRGDVVQVADVVAAIERVVPSSRGTITASGNALPIAANLDDSALRKDLGEVPATPLENGVRETAEIFTRLHQAGNLDVRDLDA